MNLTLGLSLASVGRSAAVPRAPAGTSFVAALQRDGSAPPLAALQRDGSTARVVVLQQEG